MTDEKLELAIAEMKEWFFTHFTDPANCIDAAVADIEKDSGITDAWSGKA